MPATIVTRFIKESTFIKLQNAINTTFTNKLYLQMMN